MVRLKDIAIAAGVTSATASTALSGRGRVSTDVRERIRKIATEMNYEPNSAALLLKKKSIIDVGFLIADKQLEPLSAFTDYCNHHHLCYQLELLPSGNLTLPLMLKSKIASGVLYSGYVSDPVRQFLTENPDFPFVDIGDSSEYSVHSDFCSGAYNAVKYLVELGHRDIALFSGNQEYDIHRQARIGLIKAVRDFNLSCGTEIPIIVQQHNDPHYMKKTLAWAEKLLQSPKRPTAVFSSGTTNAFALFYTAIRLGIRIPQDLNIISIGNNVSTNFQFVPLSTLEHDYNALIRAGMELLELRIKGISSAEKSRNIPVQFIPRESTSKRKEATS